MQVLLYPKVRYLRFGLAYLHGNVEIMLHKTRLYVIGLLTFLILFPSLSFANAGTQNITFQQYSTAVGQGGKVIIYFNLTQVSGYPQFATTVSVENSQELISNGITTVVTNAMGNPPFTGQLHLFVSNSTKTGIYYITLQGSSLNQTINDGQEQLQITQYQSTTSSTTVTASTSVATTSAQQSSTVLSTATATTTVAQTQGLGSLTNIVYYVIAIVVLIIIVMFILRMRGGSSAVPAPAPPAPPNM